MAETQRKQSQPIVPIPERTRRIAGTPFGWIDARVLRDGWFRLLTPEAISVYTFLCVAANREGVSYYRRDRIGHELGLSEAEVHAALARLVALDLAAYRPFHQHAADGFHQVLSLRADAPPRGAGA